MHTSYLCNNRITYLFAKVYIADKRSREIFLSIKPNAFSTNEIRKPQINSNYEQENKLLLSWKENESMILLCLDDSIYAFHNIQID